MNIVDSILNSQGGQAASNLAKQFNLSPQQVRSAVQSLVPQLVAGARNALQRGNVQNLLGMLQSGQLQQVLQNAQQALSSADLSQGNRILEQLFGDKSVSSEIAARAAAATGIEVEKLKQMLPALANMVMATLAKAQTSAAQAAGAALQSPLAQAAGGLINKLGGAAQNAAASGQGVADSLRSLLDGNHDSRIADELRKLAGKFLKR